MHTIRVHLDGELISEEHIVDHAADARYEEIKIEAENDGPEAGTTVDLSDAQGNILSSYTFS